MSPRRGRLRIGTSGYQYDHWRRVFYPEELPKSRWFDHYARCFDTVEINNTFYNLPAPKVFDAWRERAPKGFCYALKFSRYGSHLKRLKEARATIGRFLERATRLEDHLGPILVQLPPHWRADPDRLAAFLAEAPRRYGWVVEFRDPSWLCEPVFQILEEHNAALCVHDLIPRHPRRRTSDRVYLRFHGWNYGGSYLRSRLRAEAKRIREERARAVDVFVYFNNDADGYAVANALDLRRYAGQGRPTPDDGPER